MIGCIVQARMGSSRLPGKVMKKIANKFLLDYVLDHLKSSKRIEKDSILLVLVSFSS